MTKARTTRSTTKAPANSTGSDFAQLITELRGLIHSARHSVATTVNTFSDLL